MNYDSSLFARVEIGGGKDDAVMREELACLHLVYLCTEDYLCRGEHKELVSANIESALAADNRLDVIYALGYVFNMVSAYPLRHISAVART